jgi:ATP-dependent RNA helicase DHX29
VDDSDTFSGRVKSILSISGAGEEDKVLLRLYITFEVLRRLGFSEERVSQCIREGLGDGDGWVEGVEWVRLAYAAVLTLRCGFT